MSLLQIRLLFFSFFALKMESILFVIINKSKLAKFLLNFKNLEKINKKK